MRDTIVINGIEIHPVDSFPHELVLDSDIICETAVAEPDAPAEDKPKDPPPEESQEDKDKAAMRDSKPPPADGKCKHCGLEAKLNRLKLCYPCFVMLEIMQKEKDAGREWIPGDPHPSWCCCELPDGCATKRRAS